METGKPDLWMASPKTLIFISLTYAQVGKITKTKRSEGGNDHKFFL